MIEPGTELGQYRIVDLIATGGMGEVYLAEDTRLERRIALKVLPADMASDPERLERFEREAKAVASLNHPNIVTIHSVEDAEGPDGTTLHLITMERVDGQTLDKHIVAGGLPIDRLFAIAVPLADAVGAAHQKGITHRDLKPGNVMLTTDGRLKVLDFGLAKLAEDTSVIPVTDPTAATAATMAAAPITEEGKVLGTVAYMSPEQAEGKPVDNRSDIFSLGIMLYELSTGALPFTGDTKMSVMSSIIKDTPISVTEIKRELPNHLGRIVKRCLEKDANRRFQSAQDVRNDLADLKEEIDSGDVVTTQSSIDAMQAAGVVSEAAPPPTDPSLVSGPANAVPVATDHGVASPVPAPSDPSHVSAASGATPAPASSGGVPTAAPTGGSYSNKLLLGGIAAVVVVALGWWAVFGSGGDSSSGRGTGGSDVEGSIETIADTRPSVAILYFDNLSGDESLDWLRSGLTELLVTDLSQSPELRVLTTDALYEILDETGNLDERVTSAAIVREVAERAEVEHVVVGSFIRAGDTFRLSARLQHPATGETLAAETVEGIGEDSVFASVDDLTRRIKNRLEVPVSASPVVDRDLSDVTTTSMDAYRHYTDGVNLISQSRYQEAIPVFERAVEIDPEFAMALAKLSVVHGNMFDFENSRIWAERAIEHADRLTQRERYYIEGRYYGEDSATLLQSIEAYENALALYPDDTASRNNVAIAYGSLERYDEAIVHYEELLRRGTPFLPSYFNTAASYANNGDCDKGYELLRDFNRSRPEYHFGYQDLALLSIICGRLDEAEAALATYHESLEAGSPGSVVDGMYLTWLQMLRDEFELATETVQRLAESPSPMVRLSAYPGTFGVIKTYQGQGEDALAGLIEAAEAFPETAGGSAGMWSAVAGNHLNRGDPSSALEALDRARRTAQDVEMDAYVSALTATAQARAGRSVAAETAARQYARLSEQLPSPATERQRLAVEAELAMADDDVDTALQRRQAAFELLQPGPTGPPFDEFVQYAFPLARTLLAAGEPTRAAEVFERITMADGQRLFYPFEYVRSFYFLGKIAEEDGDAAAARRHYQRFLDYWGDGDIDTERVAEARAFVAGA